jgi:hypothetical protein
MHSRAYPLRRSRTDEIAALIVSKIALDVVAVVAERA